ncbi:diguanylate cyclase (GGDEF) domain-containing protein [Cohaesibacter sp. ES.047]|uniref:putative bifunctional diguanylate cyclase/phosphodiesterase n=1 Tax=Cohaesibacter sp. ES.047 TaxID=1798205 RepID=UPI000BB9420C|nr:bifunctional diguanylate cyclase/phosphodiesterase [Cohaesibacter sp. ES.047]SNY90402.1 diguanylate cyclase (GGDEF) domain-containing protein [Cohaesibacter sp. ES.047]
MISFLAKFDKGMRRQILAMGGLIVVNFIIALAVIVSIENQDTRTLFIVQMAMIGVISAFSCLFLLHLNRDRLNAGKALDRLSSKDKLTSIANREAFHEQLEHRVEQNKDQFPFALFCFDIDRFKELNSFLGYTSADLLLRQVGERLDKLACYDRDAARLSGDEFALILTYDGSDADLENKVCDVFGALYKSYKCHNQSVDLTFSVGLTLFPDDAVDADQLFQNAHFALERAKQDGFDRIYCYDDVADPKMLDSHFLSHDMERALQDGEFRLYYQPQYSFANGELAGFEALIRWHHKDRGIISPTVFIPIAEKNGLILPLSDLILRMACETASRWVNPLKVAVNLSPVQMQQCEINERVSEILIDTGLDPNRLELEVTESLFIDIDDRVATDLRRLRKKGISIALDDFGTGYSSLAYLTSFPFDKIKIDRSFVQNLATDNSCMAIISAVIGMGKSLDMRITAEGIEDEKAYEMLRLAGCDEAQGYLLGKPRDLSVEPGEEMERPARDIAISA